MTLNVNCNQSAVWYVNCNFSIFPCCLVDESVKAKIWINGNILCFISTAGYISQECTGLTHIALGNLVSS